MVVATVRRAHELARTASQLAYEAAGLCQMVESSPANRATLAAAQASIQAAKRAFQLDDETRARTDPPADVAEALRLSREALDDASEAVRAARDALDAAILHHARSRVDGGTAGAG